MYKIIDWIGNEIFPDKKFTTYEDGWEYIYEHIEEEFEDDGTYDDYYVVEIQ